MYSEQLLVVIMTLFSLMTASAASSYVVQGERDTARILKNSKNQNVKRSKKGKAMKKSKKGGVVTSAPSPPIVTTAPTAPPTLTPTVPPTTCPTAPSTGTSSPTSIDSISSRSSPLIIAYSPLTDTPTTEDYKELTRATQKYLEDFLVIFFI